MLNVGNVSCLLFRLSRRVEDYLEGERLEEVTLALVELTLELHPVQTQGMQEGGESLHEYEYRHRDGGPACEHYVQEDAALVVCRHQTFP